MELSDIILALVGIVSMTTGFVVKNIMADIKELEHNMTTCQSQMPKEYVLKDDYKSEMREIKKMLGNIYNILREQDK